jgi:hypothetical protein
MDCIDKILDFYDKRNSHELRDIKIRLGKILIKLMDDLVNPKNFERVQNCLILMINLFFDIEPPDHYHTQGKSRSELSDDELNKVNEMLKNAILNNLELN